VKGRTASIVPVVPRVAEYAKVRTGVTAAYNVGWFPQRLWTACAFDLPAGRSHMPWLVSGTHEETARPGQCETTVRFTAEVSKTSLSR
jgi:hypothetical protein